MKTFNGGVHVPDNKYITEYLAVEQMPVVPDYFISLSQHIGAPAKPVVAVGDVVAEGQLIAEKGGFVSANIHSPISGEVIGIEKRQNRAGGTDEFIHVKTDGKQTVTTYPALDNPTAEQIAERIDQAGIVGLGGAGFPTFVKLKPKTPVDTLVINAAECEPYLNCDNRLMIERAEEVMEGVKLIARALNLAEQNVIVGIEANKMEAYDAMRAVAGGAKVELLKKKYPQGAEKTLIYATTKRKVPCGKLPADVGVVVQNVATAFAVYEAVKLGKPLYRRILTVSGKGIANPKNLEVRVGTPISSIIEFCGGLSEDVVKVVDGGPMMGMALQTLDVFTTKTDSGLLALTSEEASLAEPSPCINCGKCAAACPMHLMPMYIDLYANLRDFDSAVKYGAKNCFECGTCAYVCPAKRQIVQSVKLTKQKTKEKK